MASRTTDDPPASLASLPNEILSEIIGLLLPKNVCKDTFVQSYPYPDHPWRGRITRPTWEKDPDKHRWAILYTDRRLTAEVLRFLHIKKYSLFVDEYSACWESVVKVKATAKKTSELEDPYPYVPFDVALTKCRSFRGLDFSRISELTIDIQPSDLGTFWSSLDKTLIALCYVQLIPRGPIRNLVIRLQDMRCSSLSNEIA